MDTIENSFLQLEKLDLQIKDASQKLKSSKTQEAISQIQTSTQAHFLNYQNYLDKISIFSTNNNPEIREKLQVQQEQLQLTRSTYRKRLLQAQQDLQINNKNELLGNNNNNINNIRKRNTNKSKTSNMEQLKAMNRTMSDSVTMSQKVLVNLKEQEEENLKTEKNVTDMKSNIDDGEHLISKYKQRARTDQMLIRLGVFTFVVTCGYIILKRVFGFFL